MKEGEEEESLHRVMRKERRGVEAIARKQPFLCLRVDGGLFYWTKEKNPDAEQVPSAKSICGHGTEKILESKLPQKFHPHTKKGAGCTREED